jgi:predicted TIM-barrel fold metal-dependent hydrolase
LIDTFSDNKIVLAHWGGGLFFFSLLKKEVKQRLGHVYFDTAASPYLYDPKVYRVAIDLVGMEQILFGSDFPLLPPKRYFDEMKAVGLSKGEMNKICGANAAALFNLGD